MRTQMQKPSTGIGTAELLYTGAVVLAALAASLFLHLGAGEEPPDNPGAAAQLAAAAAPQGAPASASHDSE
jgi:hypothetical protein